MKFISNNKYMSEETKIKIKTIAIRFLRGAITGALTTMGLVTIAMPQNWTELATALNILLLAGVFGAINGVLSGGDKWLRWKE
jgi:uncharacterized membrane protein